MARIQSVITSKSNKRKATPVVEDEDSMSPEEYGKFLIALESRGLLKKLRVPLRTPIWRVIHTIPSADGAKKRHAKERINVREGTYQIDDYDEWGKTVFLKYEDAEKRRMEWMDELGIKVGESDG